MKYFLLIFAKMIVENYKKIKKHLFFPAHPPVAQQVFIYIFELYRRVNNFSLSRKKALYDL